MNYFYYVVFEFELEGGGIGQGSCEFKSSKKVKYLSDIVEMSKQLQQSCNCVKPPKITFYSLLRKERCFNLVSLVNSFKKEKSNEV
jgi:predicted ATPase